MRDMTTTGTGIDTVKLAALRFAATCTSRARGPEDVVRAARLFEEHLRGESLPVVTITADAGSVTGVGLSKTKAGPVTWVPVFAEDPAMPRARVVAKRYQKTETPLSRRMLAGELRTVGIGISNFRAGQVLAELKREKLA